MGVYYHGMLPTYGRIVEYDGYRIGNVIYNKTPKNHVKFESPKISTSLNPNAQEFVPRGWLNPNNEKRDVAVEGQRVIVAEERCIPVNQISLEGQTDDLSASPGECEGSGDCDIAVSTSNNGIEVINYDGKTPDPSEDRHPEVEVLPTVKEESGSELDEKCLKVDVNPMPTFQNKPINNDSTQPTYFTFKDKLLARVNSKTTSSHSNVQKATSSDGRTSSENSKNSTISKVDDTKYQKTETKFCGSFHENSSKATSEDKTKQVVLAKSVEVKEVAENRKKQTGAVGVSWAQRLKNSTNTQNSGKVIIETPNQECSSFRTETKHQTADDKQEFSKSSRFANLKNISLTNGFQDKNEKSVNGLNESKSNESDNSGIIDKTSVREVAIVAEDEVGDSSRLDVPNNISESDTKFNSNRVHTNSGVESTFSSKSALNGEKQVECSQDIAKFMKTTINYSNKIPIFILLALREVSMDFEGLETTYAPPELSRRNLTFKEGDRDGGNRGRGGWVNNINSGGKNYNREGSNVCSNSRRERYQTLSGLSNQNGKRLNDNSGNSQSSTLDWTRDERRMFRLESSAESWIVKQKEQKINGDQFENQLRQYRAILNKLTIEKFDKLFDQIISVGINNEEEMIGLLKLVFDKATTQHHFIPMYVELCDKLRDHLKDTATIETRRILVDLCQELFVENLSEMTLPESIQDNEEDSFEWQLKYKNKMKGNMIFMASLVRKKVIASTVVLMCMEELLQFHLPHHLEALCVFLHHVGPFLDSEKWKHFDDFNTLFHQFEEFASNDNVPIRIRFLIKDVIDSRKNNWKSKNTKEGPMMLDDLKSKINAERGELGNTSSRSENTSLRSQNVVSFRGVDKNSISEQNARISGSPLNAWQKQSISLGSGKTKSNLNSNSDRYHKRETSQLIKGSDTDEDLNDDDIFEDNEHILPDNIKNSVGRLMDSFVASYDFDEFFLSLNDLDIPPIYFIGVYKNMFIRIAEYKVNHRNALFKALILLTQKNKEYMDGESAKTGILMVLQPKILNDILIDVPKFKDIVSIEFIRDAISEFDPKGEIFDSAFIKQAESLLD
ncbi:eukaryotic translation initiation factor 4 gamma Nic domain containing [Cryptosporidium bovis]|uniref:eukaryotic translation initiation factor 4 gamma Nic domain containing n=1 Tax=Cryptosporidium bovis TaxID=310047 RepID=UPI00351A14F9|nr:eukaryotic translation initiation factor 4 gamma Nic domain containing [Cryptosporidium bovis]